MSPRVPENVVPYPPSVLQDPAGGTRLRYMRRRRVNRADRNGDPLDGLVNLWDIALVLAVAFLLAALTGVGLSGILTGQNMTIVKNPGEPDMQLITKQGSEVDIYDLAGGEQVSGQGTPIGELFRLADGSIIYVPASGAPATAAPYPTPTATPYPVPTDTYAPYPTAVPGDGTYQTPTPAPFTTPDATTTTGPGTTDEPDRPGKK